MPTLVEQHQQAIRESVAFKEGYDAGVQAERDRIKTALESIPVGFSAAYDGERKMKKKALEIAQGG